MQKALNNQTAETTLMVEITPTILREIADRMENAVKFAGQGESIHCPLTRKITFLFHPETKTLKLLNEDLIHVDQINTEMEMAQ